MTSEEVKQMIARERAAVLSIKEKMASPFFKDQCEHALNYLGDAELHSDNPGIVAVALEMYKSRRKTIDDAISKWGYDAVASDDPVRSRTQSQG